jgi:hypothetical protein
MSRVKDGAQIRKERVAQLIDLIEKMSEESEKRVKGMFMLRTGLTIKTIDDMLNDLEVAEIIERRDGKLVLVK